MFFREDDMYVHEKMSLQSLISWLYFGWNSQLVIILQVLVLRKSNITEDIYDAVMCELICSSHFVQLVQCSCLGLRSLDGICSSLSSPITPTLKDPSQWPCLIKQGLVAWSNRPSKCHTLTPYEMGVSVSVTWLPCFIILFIKSCSDQQFRGGLTMI